MGGVPMVSSDPTTDFPSPCPRWGLERSVLCLGSDRGVPWSQGPPSTPSASSGGQVALGGHHFSRASGNPTPGSPGGVTQLQGIPYKALGSQRQTSDRVGKEHGNGRGQLDRCHRSQPRGTGHTQEWEP